MGVFFLGSGLGVKLESGCSFPGPLPYTAQVSSSPLPFPAPRPLCSAEDAAPPVGHTLTCHPPTCIGSALISATPRTSLGIHQAVCPSLKGTWGRQLRNTAPQSHTHTKTQTSTVESFGALPSALQQLGLGDATSMKASIMLKELQAASPTSVAVIRAPGRASWGGEAKAEA